MSKTFEELTIKDNFMFGAVMKNPIKCKAVLECILNVKIRKIEYPELEKTIDNSYESKSVRLDVYIEDDKNTIYNVEMQATNKRNLPKRTRYYQGMIDLNIINKSDDYNKLKKSYVIFICDYDEFGFGRHIYTFEKRCNEVPELVLGDETTVVVLNTRGTANDVNEEIKGLLDYIAGNTPNSKLAMSLNDEVQKIKSNEDWRRDYMTLLMRDKEMRNIGGLKKVITLVKKKYKSMTVEEMSDVFDVNEDIVSTILDHLDMDEEELAEILVDY